MQARGQYWTASKVEVKPLPTSLPISRGSPVYPRTSLLFMRTHALRSAGKRTGETPILPWRDKVA
jgi:hypothetical protein